MRFSAGPTIRWRRCRDHCCKRREERGMAGRGAGVGVIVIAVGEVGAMVEQQAEPPSPNWSR